MRNENWFHTPARPKYPYPGGSKALWKHSILAVSLSAAFLSSGCPKNDPLQAFNDPPKTQNPPDPNNPNDPGPAPVPEPATTLLFGAALLIGGGILRRHRNRNHA
jgi:hypothetical protein